MRRNASSWVSWLIFGGIIIVFIFFFGTSGSLPGGIQGRGTVAIVNGAPISGGEFAFAYDNTENYYKQLFSGVIPQEFQQTVETTALQQLIGQKLQAQAAHDLGLAIGDTELATRIRALPLFAGDDGQFSAVSYQRVRESWLSQYRMDFEKSISEQLTGDAARELLTEPGPLSETYFANNYKRERSTWTFDVVRIPQDRDNASTLSSELSEVFADSTARSTWLEEHKLSASTVGPITVSRYEQLLDSNTSADTLATVFALDQGDLCPTGLAQGSDLIVCAVSARDTSTAEQWEENRDQYQSQQRSLLASTRSQHWLDTLRDAATIDANASALSQ